MALLAVTFLVATGLPSVIFLFLPLALVDQLWVFSLYASGGALFLILQAKTLPALVMGWSASFIGHFLILMCLERQTVALFYLVIGMAFIVSLFFLKGHLDHLCSNNSSLLNLILILAIYAPYIPILFVESLTDKMMDHALTDSLVFFYLFLFYGISQMKPFFWIATSQVIGLLSFFAWLGPLYDPIFLFLVLPFKGAAALFVLFRAKTLPEQIVGCAAFNGALILILFLLDLLDFLWILLWVLLFALFLLLSVFQEVTNKAKFIVLLHSQFNIIFMGNLAISVVFFTLGVIDPNESLYEHGIAISALITFIYVFQFWGNILRFYEEEV